MLSLLEVVSIGLGCVLFFILQCQRVEIRPNGQAPGLLFFATSRGG
jgi:hypothetical protein